MAFGKNKIQQLVVQFACKIPTRKELSSAEKKALENSLRDLDPNQEFFQLFFEEPSQKSPCFFHAARQYTLNAATITVPSFVFVNDSISLCFPVKLGDKTFTRDKSYDTKDINKKMVNILMEIQNTIKGLRYLRTGKIFELILGPFLPADKKSLFKNLVHYDLDDVGEFNLTFARFVKSQNGFLNIQTVVNFQQLQLDKNFPVAVRIDINNRQLAESLEPTEIAKVWDEADELIWEHMESIVSTEKLQ